MFSNLLKLIKITGTLLFSDIEEDSTKKQSCGTSIQNWSITLQEADEYDAKHSTLLVFFTDPNEKGEGLLTIYGDVSSTSGATASTRT